MKAIPAEAEYYNLGSFSRPITTTSKDAQEWFNRGLIWSYGFHHMESAYCFEQAIAHDNNCAIAYWGLAYALGPNYNKPWEMFDENDLNTTLERTNQAARKAKELIDQASPVERALINAIQNRFPEDYSKKDFPTWNLAYANAMKPVYQQFSEDLDIAALYADAMMNLTPWALWDLVTAKPNPNARTVECEAVLEQALKNEAAYSHPCMCPVLSLSAFFVLNSAILHLYIHLMEMSPTPGKALHAANHLRNLSPDSGHLRHMPSHLDILLGDYRQAIASNYDATIADEKIFKYSNGWDFYAFYRLHDYHSLIYAAMFAGQKQISIKTCDRMEASIPEGFLRVTSPPMADWLESFAGVRPHVLIRFGCWQTIIDLELPVDQELYCVTTATIFYAKGIAYAATGRVKEAEEEQAKFRVAVKKIPLSRLDFPNKSVDVLAVAEEMLSGELEYRRGNYDLAFTHLKKSIVLDDNLLYSEPWSWMMPTRHAYAALCLEQGKVEEAAATYAEDLGFGGSLPKARHHPNNIWALTGYYDCLVKLGRDKEARIIEQQISLAGATADVPITTSCFCAVKTLSKCCSK